MNQVAVKGKCHPGGGKPHIFVTTVSCVFSMKVYKYVRAHAQTGKTKKIKPRQKCECVQKKEPGLRHFQNIRNLVIFLFKRREFVDIGILLDFMHTVWSKNMTCGIPEQAH